MDSFSASQLSSFAMDSELDSCLYFDWAIFPHELWYYSSGNIFCVVHVEVWTFLQHPAGFLHGLKKTHRPSHELWTASLSLLKLKASSQCKVPTPMLHCSDNLFRIMCKVKLLPHTVLCIWAKKLNSGLIWPEYLFLQVSCMWESISSFFPQDLFIIFFLPLFHEGQIYEQCCNFCFPLVCHTQFQYKRLNYVFAKCGGKNQGLSTLI